MARLHEWLFEMHNQIRFTDKDLLRRARQLNTDRLRTGLELLGHSPRFDDILQGSMALHTMTRRDQSDVDVDLAVIFREQDLPSSPLDARTLVHRALEASSPASFHRSPSRRTNAVTAWYSSGYHVDLAVHRRRQSGVLEHGGAQWTRSDPMALRGWFTDTVGRLSPGYWASRVADGQLRRLVRLTKWAFGESGGHFPGGYFLTLLVAECYRPSPNGDDEALLRTLVALRSRLNRTTEVVDPVSRQVVSARAKDRSRLQRFGHDLGNRLVEFEGLNQQSSIGAWKAAYKILLDL